MISFDEAYQIVLDSARDFGIEIVQLLDSTGRILAEDIYADRDFPPFDRVTKDGIAVNSNSTNLNYKIEGICPAGSPQGILKENTNCLEVMTGAMLPENTDAVIMYEEVEISNGNASVNCAFKKHQNIHFKGSDIEKGEQILSKNCLISAKEIGVLATIGKTEVQVMKLPKVAIISTGNELVSIEQTPLPYQIRTSNSYSIKALLDNLNVKSSIMHIADDKEILAEKIEKALNEFDVLILSGGVSKGKYDFLPEIFDKLKVQKKFHRVAQQPGKPFWFGYHSSSNTNIFSFPGNPVSTFVNFHLYFLNWLKKSTQQEISEIQIILKNAIENTTSLTKFLLVDISDENGKIIGELVNGNGSGDLISLTKASGVIKIEKESVFEANSLFSYMPFQ